MAGLGAWHAGLLSVGLNGHPGPSGWEWGSAHQCTHASGEIIFNTTVCHQGCIACWPHASIALQELHISWLVWLAHQLPAWGLSPRGPYDCWGPALCSSADHIASQAHTNPQCRALEQGDGSVEQALEDAAQDMIAMVLGISEDGALMSVLPWLVSILTSSSQFSKHSACERTTKYMQCFNPGLKAAMAWMARAPWMLLQFLVTIAFLIAAFQCHTPGQFDPIWPLWYDDDNDAEALAWPRGALF